MLTQRSLLTVALLLPCLLGLAGSLAAKDGKIAGYERIWSRAEFYTGDDGSLVQSLRLTGRLQLDLAHVAEDASEDEFNVRRFRLGFKALFRGHWTVHIEGDFDLQDTDPFYNQLTDAYLSWGGNDAFNFTLGKQSVGFTLDGMTSSKKLRTIDRSNLANNIWFTQEYIPGVSAKGKRGNTSYLVGVYSSGDKNRELGEFNGGTFVLLTLGHDFGSQFGAEQALLRLNWVDNEPDANNGFTRPLERIQSLSFVYDEPRWGIGADLSTASGYLGQPDLDGLMVMSYYKLSEATEWVARYTVVESSGDNGVRFARYENLLADGRGDSYEEVYLGLNYYLHGHLLKLQGGIQFAEMKDRPDDGGAYSGWSATGAFRVSW